MTVGTVVVNSLASSLLVGARRGSPESGGASGTGGTTSTEGTSATEGSGRAASTGGGTSTGGAASTGDGGYRSQLFKLIVAVNQKVTFTGLLTNGPTQVSGQKGLLQ